jgi:hypothetical protein
MPGRTSIEAGIVSSYRPPSHVLLKAAGLHKLLCNQNKLANDFYILNFNTLKQIRQQSYISLEVAKDLGVADSTLSY